MNRPDPHITAPSPSDVAIVGMSAIVPGAGDVRAFWENTLRERDAIVEVPADRWDWRLYYDADPKAPDKIVSKWGGFVPDVPFDPIRYGMPPSSLPSIEPVQLLLLEATRAAIEDAGYAERTFDRERTAVVLGMGGGAAQLAMGYAFRSYLPMLDAVKPGAGREALDACEGLLPEWTEDSFPGFLLNVAAGRLANRFDLGGANYTVDAACGSSLAAANLAVRELESGAADMVILGGADTVQNPFTYLAFSKTQAFSPRGRCRPFDASADGIVISEGVAVLVLKRLADAERDGDRIYAVIKGLGASSDGRARGLTAPSPEGQVRAVKRAYAKSGVEPSTVGYVEAHGTGTAVGDVVEVNAISGVFREHGVESASTAIGSVKSMIGHTKCAAGLAGLINASLALHHRVLPPTIGVEAINPKADLLDGPFRVNTEPRPWLHSDINHPRRAAVSAFGFGGTNFHAVLEAHDSSITPIAPIRDWPVELFAWRALDETRLLADLDSLARSIDHGARPRLRDLARAVNLSNPPGDEPGPTLAVVASDLDDLRDKIRAAREAIAAGKPGLDDPRGVYYARSPAFFNRPVAFLFPGQGSQYPGMLAELAMAFPEVREGFEAVDAALDRRGVARVGPIVFPSPAVDEVGRDRHRAAIRATDAAQPALAGSAVGLLRLLAGLGVKPNVVAGHSFGELAALHAAGALTASGLAELARERGRLMLGALGDESGGMLALAGGPAEVARLMGVVEGLIVANDNGPGQAVLAGPSEAIEQAVEASGRMGIRVKALPVGGPFHTPSVADASLPLAETAARSLIASPDRPVYSNLDAQVHPTDVGSIARRIGEHVASPVRFAPMVESMHADGARVFIEAGPGAVLSGLVGSILGDLPHLAVACDNPARPGVGSLLITLARLVAAGVPARLGRLSDGRSDRTLDLYQLPVGDGSPTPSATTWLVNGSRARPIDQPEPRRLGQGPALPYPEPVPVAQAPPPTARDGSVNGHHSTIGPHCIGKPMIPNPHRIPDPVLPTPAPTSGGDDRVMMAFQETMRAFLDVQRSTMLAYLNGRSVPATIGRPGLGLDTGVAAVLKPEPKAATITGEVGPTIAVEPPNHVVPPQPPLSKPEPSPANSMGRDAVAARLLEIVRDRTGYPTEMLGLDLDMEADLGIDSIKRVEILGTLRDSVPALAGASDSATTDALARARTLGAIVDRVEEITRKPGKDDASPPPLGPAATVPEVAPTESAVRRMTLEAVNAPLANGRSGLRPGGLVVVTDDGRGVGRSVADGMEAAGHPVELVGTGDLDFASPSAVDRFLAEVRTTGDLAGIVHALPLRDLPAAGLDPSAWAARMGPEVKGLFLLARGAANDLDRSARRGGSALIAATAMGGGSASSGPPVEFFPGHGGILGLVKTLAREWPGVRARAVDLDPREPADRLAAWLVAETLADDGWSEVGYLAGRRSRLRAVPSPMLGRSAGPIELARGEPIVVTGGARGITATVVAELAKHWRPTLLLLGRSPLPPESEAAETARIASATELKAALHARLRRDGKPVTPAELERAYQSVRRAREIRANLDALRAAGATVEYAGVDVRDASALADVLDGWKARFGDPVGLVHGAGVIKDKLIRDKSPESFDHVLGTKLDGALNLARLLRADSIRFAALFSSIAGRFGNAGQADYAAANEVLNKLARWLDRRWPGRVVSMIWGPWSGVGMVSDLEGHLGGRGLGMIAPEVGRGLLLDELRFGRQREVEVIAAGDLGGLDGPMPIAPGRGKPMLAEAGR